MESRTDLLNTVRFVINAQPGVHYFGLEMVVVGGGGGGGGVPQNFTNYSVVDDYGHITVLYRMYL